MVPLQQGRALLRVARRPDRLCGAAWPSGNRNVARAPPPSARCGSPIPSSRRGARPPRRRRAARDRCGRARHGRGRPGRSARIRGGEPRARNRGPRRPRSPRACSRPARACHPVGRHGHRRPTTAAGALLDGVRRHVRHGALHERLVHQHRRGQVRALAPNNLHAGRRTRAPRFALAGARARPQRAVGRARTRAASPGARR